VIELHRSDYQSGSCCESKGYQVDGGYGIVNISVYLTVLGLYILFRGIFYRLVKVAAHRNCFEA
jgi:hypothetical protein